VAATETSPHTTEDSTAAATTAPEPTATFVGAATANFEVDLAINPYFVGAANEVWVGSLAGELVRLDGATGGIVARTMIPQSSPFAVDANAVWVADAIGGDVIRLDPVDGHEVARIPTGVEILDNSFRQPMLEGTAQSLAQIGGIASSGDAVWVGDRAGAVMRIDPATNTIVATFDVPVRPDLLRVDGQQLLIADLLGAGLAVIDTDDGTVVYESGRLDDMAGAGLYAGAAYRQDRATGTVTRIDLTTGGTSTSVALGPPQERSGTPTLPTGLVVSSAGVLVDTTTTPNGLHILDPNTLEEIGTLPTTPDQGDMTIAADGTVWLVRSLANETVHITPTPL
jgi:outer membrane protein assembly factor BamB